MPNESIEKIKKAEAEVEADLLEYSKSLKAMKADYEEKLREKTAKAENDAEEYYRKAIVEAERKLEAETAASDAEATAIAKQLDTTAQEKLDRAIDAIIKGASE